MEQKAYWDSVSATKEFTTPFQAEEFSKYVAGDARVVDVGCGYGRTLDELYRLGYTDLTGFDFSEKMIDRGRAQFPYLTLRVKTGDTLDLPDGSADAVILFAVLTCIVPDAEQEALISEIYRILKPGGILYINDFLLNADARNLARYEAYKDTLGVYGAFELPEGARLRHHTEEHIRALLQDFAPRAYERLTFTTMNGHTANGFYYIGAK